MTPSELKYQFERNYPDSNFFDHQTMRFFGDTMKNYGVCKCVVDTWAESSVPVYELYRKRPVKHGNSKSTFFAQDDFRIVYAKIEPENEED